MGWFDKLKEVAIKAKCAVGLHAGEFAPIAGGPKCHLEKTCKDCFEYFTKIEHEFIDPDNYDNPGSCVKTSKCKFCDKSVQKVIHENFKEVGMNNNCKVIEKCKRCGDEKLGAARHDYKEVGKDGYCRLIEKCNRCGEKHSAGESHSWIRDAEHRGQGASVAYVCADCGKKETRSY